ncbi:hypothetical protein W97_05588 [Coniosporium apollinis CBS 100218]|uniref:CENP-V/GFA domain-containing protein n=1 Tax=Coniosporium apollinis (strain CBS 100218) TaxID=1168221 RepID=R7YW88_CONA1|nr:uncharacterized protein W97_05588 [Coniosporium apollinis CBS 100218]EON66195.1 hypothetical protein W97_05588 [Coniosporium apollinis CBS 100218]
MADTQDPVTTLTASCLCKSTTFTVSIPNSKLPIPTHLCHCDICRRFHGTFAAFHADIPPPIGLNYDTLTSFETPCAVRYFCSTCGAQVLDRAKEGENWCVSTAMFNHKDVDDIFEYTAHIFVGDTKDGGMSDWLPSVKGKELKRWKTTPKGRGASDEELPLYWRATAPPKESAKEDRVHAHCYCNGTSFYLHRPDPCKMSRELAEKRISPRDPSKWIAKVCACDSCRLAAGAQLVPWAYVSKGHITQANGEPFEVTFGTLKAYRSSPGATRTFCGTCGAQCHYVRDGEDIVDISVGLLDAESGTRVEEWLDWQTEKLGYPEDAEGSGLVKACAEGLKAWGRRVERRKEYTS